MLHETTGWTAIEKCHLHACNLLHDAIVLGHTPRGPSVPLWSTDLFRHFRSEQASLSLSTHTTGASSSTDATPGAEAEGDVTLYRKATFAVEDGNASFRVDQALHRLVLAGLG